MLARYFGAAALALQCAEAFKDASPFFMFSSSDLDTQQLQSAQVASADSISKNLSPLLRDCTKNGFVIVSQPGVSPSDFVAHQSTPHLERWLSGTDKKTKTVIEISNVVGPVIKDKKRFASVQERYCQTNEEWSSMTLDGTDGKVPILGDKPHTILVNFDAPPAGREERMSALSRYDSYLNDILVQLDSYTVVYTTAPVSSSTRKQIEQELQQQLQPAELTEHHYEMDSPFPPGMHGDLKRDLSARASSSNNTGNLHSNLPLFEKYQFVNQGIFITGSVTLLLLLILYVGVSAIANLEVSYMAFSKEMGPAAQKKQQQ